MLLTSRPDNQPALGGHPHVTRLTLNRLGRGPTEAIVARLAGGRGLPPEVLGEIAARTDGVPLFVEELTKAVLEAGHGGTGGGGAGLAARLADGPAGPGARGQGGGAGGGLHRARVRLPAARGGLAGAGSRSCGPPWTGSPRPSWSSRGASRPRRATPSSTRWCGTPPTRACSRRSGSSCTPASSGCWRSASRRRWTQSPSCSPGTAPRRGSSSRRSTTGSGPGSRRSRAPRWPRRSRS